MGHRSSHNAGACARKRPPRPVAPRDRLAAEHGFTLIEVLVVVVIIAALAAIALPAFASQRHKAVDAAAQELARTAQTTAETIAVDNGGSYENVTIAEVHRYEPSIPTSTEARPAYLSAATHAASEYSITVTAQNGDEFTISRDATGDVTRECASPVEKTGCSGGEHGTW